MKVQTVSQVVGQIKNILENEFVDLTVEGEITNLSRSSAGHYYFNISDDQSAISCALFKMDSMRNPIIRRMKDGDKVILRGPISVYQKRGTFQLIVKRITPVGKGDLKAQYEKLKVNFTKKGYFDLEHKKQIPSLPKRIAVITALGAAALQDFLNIMKRRALWHDIVIVPATVQGDNCAKSIIKALELIEKKNEFDVIVITRGGGSLEDLWGFNDEKLIEKVFEIDIPVISAVGHQVDYTLLDYVSDLRCETPSAAAETLSQPHTLIQKKLYHSGKYLRISMLEIKSELEKKIFKLNPVNSIYILKEKLGTYEKRLFENNLAHKHDPLGLSEYYLYLDDLHARLLGSLSTRMRETAKRVDNAYLLLGSLNPRNVLKRGYSIISDSQGEVLTSHKQFDKLGKNEEISIQFNDGIGRANKQDKK